MDYTNTHGVRFKLLHRVTSGYTVKYYTGSGKAWPRTYRGFHCPTDEYRQEMFYILNNTRLCTVCKVELLDHRCTDENPVCQACVLRKASEACIHEDSIPECPVCYNKMMFVDNSKRILPCRHEVCPSCFTRMLKPSQHVHYDGHRPVPVGIITCPMCRREAHYDLYSNRQVNLGNTI